MRENHLTALRLSHLINFPHDSFLGQEIPYQHIFNAVQTGNVNILISSMYMYGLLVLARLMRDLIYFKQ